MILPRKDEDKPKSIDNSSADKQLAANKCKFCVYIYLGNNTECRLLVDHSDDADWKWQSLETIRLFYAEAIYKTGGVGTAYI